MFKFTKEVKSACEMLFDLYDINIENPEMVEAFLNKKISDGDIESSLKSNLITKQEFCSFVLGHLYTHSIMNITPRKEPADPEIDLIRGVFFQALFPLGDNQQNN